MSTTKFEMKAAPFNPARYVDVPAVFADYLTEALDTGDPVFFADALGVIVRACNMYEVACEFGVSRENPCSSLSTDSNPEFAAVMRVIQALGLRLCVSPNKAA